MPAAIYVDQHPTSPGPTGRGFSKLSRALSKLNLRSPISSEPDHRLELIQSLRKEQSNLLKSSHVNARKILSHTAVPAGLCNSRLRDYVHSMAITPQGTAFPPQYSEIIPGQLFIADHFTGTDVAILARLRITHVVSILHAPNAEFATLPGVVYHEIVVPYDAYHARGLVATIDDAVDFMDGALESRRDGDDDYDDGDDGISSSRCRVLVHCRMGVQWGPSMVIAWLMRNAQCDYERAKELVVRKRQVVAPAVDLEKAVKEWWALEMARPVFPMGRGGRCRPSPSVHCLQWHCANYGMQEEWESDDSDVLDIK